MKSLLIIALISIMQISHAFGQYGVQQQGEKFPWPEGKKAAISLTFDDARFSQIDQGIPLLDEYQVQATFYVSLHRVEERLEQWKTAIENGHEVGNHSMTHPCTGNFPWSRSRALEDYTLTQMEQEIHLANQKIKELLEIETNSYAYPCGQKFVGRGVNTQSYVPLIARNFLTGRGWLDEGPNDPFFCDFAQLMGMPMDNISWEELKPTIDDAIAKGSWLVLAGHEISTSGRQTTYLNTLEKLLAYANNPENGIWIANVTEVARYVQKIRK
jgi:peptidoglycan-N-acetylglucosamine deacetylase